MGAKKQWPGKEKLAIVLQGLKGDCSVSGLCNDHGIPHIPPENRLSQTIIKN